jgi:hypothetical protein
MNKLILAGAAALAFAVPAVPAISQDMAVDANGNVYVMTDAQQAVYDASPAAQQTIYTGWPNTYQTTYWTWPDTYQTYFWTLTPQQQTGWWVLTDDQRAKLYAMTPEARTAAWTSIASQMANMPSANASTTAQVATTAAAMNTAGNPNFVSNAVTQTTPAATNTDYPPCKGAVQDHCVNPREAGLNYGNRPLNRWPGKPASEIPGPKKQN